MQEKKKKSWGPKVHMLIMATAAFLPYTISAILAFTVAGQVKPKPHSVSVYMITMESLLTLETEHWHSFIPWFMVSSNFRGS